MEAEETPDPPRKFIIPKKSAHTPMEVGKKESTGDKMESLPDVSGPSRTFKDDMLPAEVGPVVRPKTKIDARVTFVGETAGESGTTVRQPEGQFEKDLAV